MTAPLAWFEIHLSGAMRKHLQRGARAYRADVEDGHLICVVQSSVWHQLSIQHRRDVLMPDGNYVSGRAPTLEEITSARRRFVPDGVMMGLVIHGDERHQDSPWHLYEMGEGPDNETSESDSNIDV